MPKKSNTIIKLVISRERIKMKQELIKVEGMTCQHCVETITKALKSISGLNSVDVILDNKEVSVRFDENETNLPEINKKIVEIGFELAEN